MEPRLVMPRVFQILIGIFRLSRSYQSLGKTFEVIFIIIYSLVYSKNFTGHVYISFFVILYFSKYFFLKFSKILKNFLHFLIFKKTFLSFFLFWKVTPVTVLEWKFFQSCSFFSIGYLICLGTCKTQFRSLSSLFFLIFKLFA